MHRHPVPAEPSCLAPPARASRLRRAERGPLDHTLPPPLLAPPASPGYIAVFVAVIDRYADVWIVPGVVKVTGKKELTEAEIEAAAAKEAKKAAAAAAAGAPKPIPPPKRISTEKIDLENPPLPPPLEFWDKRDTDPQYAPPGGVRRPCKYGAWCTLLNRKHPQYDAAHCLQFTHPCYFIHPGAPDSKVRACGRALGAPSCACAPRGRRASGGDGATDASADEPVAPPSPSRPVGARWRRACSGRRAVVHT